ncbi:uncharacterized protein B0T15DRAFT_493817 [Chaetomium strumarium]|uniref:Uncharacterized protein n=1 Tax=Chaetomium strumarium TaxID=1170767 RepID=A0AAJ0GT90_9PEZI|nr:hypothetical protein B0T15DRAFT_493817 [Chaetomium strumarium]
MGSHPLSIPNNGPASNVGQVEVQTQNNQFASGAKDVRVDERKQVFYTYHITLNDSPRPDESRWPEYWRDGARFAQRSNYSNSPNDSRWSVLLADFASAQEDARLNAEIQQRWQQTWPSVRKLEEAVVAFRSSKRHKGGKESDDSDIADEPHPPDIVTEDAVHAELEASICFYKRGSRKQSPVLGSLRAISTNTTRDQDRPDDDVVETVATIVRAFTGGLDDYFSAMRANRLTRAMETDTIEIFESLAAIFVQLLEFGRRRLRCSIPAETLLGYLGYEDAGQSTREIDSCLRLARPNARGMRTLAAFTKRREYQKWLKTESEHSALLVRPSSTWALEQTLRRRSFSPLSFLYARLAREYAGQSRVVVLSYFCGLHAPGGDAAPGATVTRAAGGTAHLLSQLIGQLLSHPTVARIYAEEPVLFDRHWTKGIKAWSVKKLIKVFSALVGRLRPHKLVIFCFIDAITRLETRGPGRELHLQEDAESLFAELRDLVQEQKKGRKRMKGDYMVFKLLVSAGARRVAAQSFFDTGEVIDLG